MIDVRVRVRVIITCLKPEDFAYQKNKPLALYEHEAPIYLLSLFFHFFIFVLIFVIFLLKYKITKRPRVGAGRIMDMFTEPYKLVRRCEVTAILILYSLPRLLTGSILAHEMMHAWLRLKGSTFLSFFFSFLL